MRIINIIDTIDKVNFGIWNAAISTASSLKTQFGINSELWFPKSDFVPNIEDVELVSLTDVSTKYISTIVSDRDLHPVNCLVVTHGCWQYATQWGAEFKKRGFKWIYVPHGMLEPWSMNQKKLKKSIYFKLVEYPKSKKADKIRAVGKPEWLNLNKKYNNTTLIPNGIEVGTSQQINKPSEVTNYLFMARLHHKKGIIPLLKAWINSKQSKSEKYHLYIAGPDDGELNTLKQLISDSNCKNVTYTGSVYGEEKQLLINKCHIYLLPSYSEGFPTSVLEAMNNHLLAIITEGCNFPEAIESNYALKTSPNQADISEALNKVYHLTSEEIKQQATEGARFVKENYSLEVIAQQQYQLIQQLGFKYNQ